MRCFGPKQPFSPKIAPKPGRNAQTKGYGEYTAFLQVGIHIYIYIYILQSTPLSQLYVAPPHGSKVRAKGTKWSIHVVEGAKLGQNGLKTLV